MTMRAPGFGREAALIVLTLTALLWLAIGCQPPPGGVQPGRPTTARSITTRPSSLAQAKPAPLQSPSKPPTVAPVETATDETNPPKPEAPSVADAAPASQPSMSPGFGYAVEEHRLVSDRDEIVSVLKNGASVIIKRVPSPVTTVRGYVFAGSMYEGRWMGGGLSHLLEHLVAGGSNDRRTEAENNELLQKIGNDSNAYTYFDQTAYFVNTTTEFLDPAVDLVTGWMLGAKITQAEFEREREVVQRELEMDKGDPDFVFSDLAQLTRYRVAPARVPIIGYQEVIQALSRDDVYSYYRMAYQPNNMIFSVAGNQDPEVMLSAVQKYLKNAKPGRDFSHDIADEPGSITPRSVVATFPKLGQARLQIGFPGIRLDSPDLYAMDLLATVLGSGESSLFIEQLRDEQHLVKDISVTDDTPHYVTGTFSVMMVLDPPKIQPATESVLKLLEDVKSKGVEPERLQRAKTQMKAARIKRLQTSEGIAESMAEDLMTTGDPHFSETYLQRIDTVTVEQLKAVAKTYFQRDKLLTTALLPSEFTGEPSLPKAEDLLRHAVPTSRPSKEEPGSSIVRTVLDDGTILLTRRITTSPLVTIQLYSLGGVTAEDDKNNGIGSLAMHMLARGTKTRSARQIAEFFDSTGGDLDTSCGTNSWIWNATCLKDDFAKTMDVYADIISHPAFDAKELADMKELVKAEIAQQDAEWTAQASRFFKKTYYGPLNSPYRLTPIGTDENVTAFTPDGLRKWYEETILPSKKVLAVFGDVDPAEVEKLARAFFGKGNKAARIPEIKATAPQLEPNETGKPDVIVERVELNKTDKPLAGVVIGYDSPSVIGEAATFPMAVADTMTSGYSYPTGYLHETLRGLGLVYVVHAQNIAGRDADLPGVFMVYAGCDPKNVNKVIDLILENIARVQGTDADMNVDWFKRSKDLIVVAEAMENETPAAQAQQTALDELYGMGYKWHLQFADKIRAVQLPDVREIARNRLRKCVVTVSTPAPELVKVATGRRQYTKLPPVDLTPRGVQHDTGGSK